MDRERKGKIIDFLKRRGEQAGRVVDHEFVVACMVSLSPDKGAGDPWEPAIIQAAISRVLVEEKRVA